jgi:hypothetical protein
LVEMGASRVFDAAVILDGEAPRFLGGFNL